MHFEAFVPTMDQSENLGLIELHRLREKPPLLFEFVVSVKFLTGEDLLHGSKQMEIGGGRGCQIRALWWLFQTSQSHPCNFSKIVGYMRTSVVVQQLNVLICRTVLGREWHFTV